jgi:hypothetical protein
MIPKYQLSSLPAEFADALSAHLGLAPATPRADARAAAAFVRVRGLVMLWGGTELPSLQEAAAGVAVPRMTLASPGVGAAWTWAKTLTEAEHFACVKLFRNRLTLVARRLWPVVAALAPCPEHLWRAGKLSNAAHEVAAFLEKEGPASTLELRECLPRRVPVLPASLQKGLRELEEKLVIYPRRLAEHVSGKDVNTWELVWRGLGGGAPASPAERAAALTRLLDGVVKSAGIVDAGEAPRWLSPVVAESATVLAAMKSLPAAVAVELPEFDALVSRGLHAALRHSGSVAATR